MTLQELAQLVSLGEGANLEFKRKVPKPERIAKEMIALANTKGGRLLLGVDDDGTIVGLRDAEEEEFALRRALNAHVSPPLEFTAERVPVARRRDVVIVHVPASSSRPHYLRSRKNGSDHSAYVRVNDKSVEASREAIRLMKDEDASAVTFEFGDNELMLMRYLEKYGKITVKQFARIANISRGRASSTLVLLTRANVLRLHADHRHDYFTLAYES
ncbi:MAG: ATP-binding protein [Rhodothermales bacterium]